MEHTIYGRFQQMVSAYRDRPAVIENDRTLSFGELSGMVDRLAGTFPAGLKTAGVVLAHRAELIAAILAVLKAGAAYVPAEPAFPAGRIRYMMREAGAEFVLTDELSAARLDGLPVRYIDSALHGAAGVPARPAVCDPALPAYILYTSGTTGRPKGVCVTNRNVCHYARAFHREFDNGPGDIMLQYSVCSFDIFVEEVFASLLNGAAIAIPSEQDKADLPGLMAFVQRHGVSMISGFPYLLAEMNRLPAIPSTLRLLISGGDVLRGHYVDRLVPQVPVYNTYGPSETTVCASYYCCNRGAVLADGTYPIGTPVQGVRVRILDENGRELPDGEAGEICIYGDGVSNGYVGDHEEENRAFVCLPDGEKMYRSGDLGFRLPDGNFAFLHRRDTQIMIYGRRVEVMEVESRLYQCSGVEQAVVRAFTDEEGLAYMVAYIVPDGPGLKVSELRAELAEDLADFMIPEFIVKMPRIPLNANGKPDPDELPVVLKAGRV